MEPVLSGATKKVLEMARKKDKFIEDRDGGGKMFSAAKLVAKGRMGSSVEFVLLQNITKFPPLNLLIQNSLTG